MKVPGLALGRGPKRFRGPGGGGAPGGPRRGFPPAMGAAGGPVRGARGWLLLLAVLGAAVGGARGGWLRREALAGFGEGLPLASAGEGEADLQGFEAKGLLPVGRRCPPGALPSPALSRARRQDFLALAHPSPFLSPSLSPSSPCEPAGARCPLHT